MRYSAIIRRTYPLSSGKPIVILSNADSEWMLISQGVPQRINLGCILFMINVHDICQKSKSNFTLVQYADDNCRSENIQELASTSKNSIKTNFNVFKITN